MTGRLIMVFVDFRGGSKSRGSLIAGLNYADYFKEINIDYRILCDPKTAHMVKSLSTAETIKNIVSIQNTAQYVRYVVKNSSPSDFFFSPHVVSFLKNYPLAKMLRCRNIFWCQGTLPHEMKIRNERTYRIVAAKLLEKFSLKFADKIIFVSNAMHDFYEKRYNSINDSIVIPCLPRTKIIKDAIRRKSSFCYIGGISNWQRVDWILMFMNNVFEVNKDARLWIYTNNIDKAKSIIDKIIDKRYLDRLVIDSLTDTLSVEMALSSKEYGFLLREKHPVNEVSSPIKFGEYISCGMNVIISPLVGDYSDLVSKYNAGFLVDDIDDFPYDSINYNLASSLDVYEKHFNRKVYLDKIKFFLCGKTSHNFND